MWIFYSLAVGAEGVVCPDHDAIGSDEVDQDTQDFGIICECVVMKSPGIILERVLQLDLSYGQPVINPSKYIREAPSRMHPPFYGVSSAMKMPQRPLKVNDLRRDSMQTPFSCMVVRKRRMKSYRNVWSATELQAKNEQWQLVCANVFGLKWSC